jgi:DUF1680 family protein
MTTQVYRQVALSAVSITSAFWSTWIDTVRSITLPYQHEMLLSTGRIDALRGNWRPGSGPEPHIFWDSDVAKWIEAACYSLITQDDPALEAQVEEVVALLAAAQQEDGYLNTYFTVVKPNDRWTDLRDAHELYCAGHLIEAGVAHAQATGRNTLLDVVRRYADCIDRTFGREPGQLPGYPGHEEIELALVKLYRATGDQRYLKLSQYFLDERGTQPFYFEEEAKRRGTVGYHGHVPPFDRRESEPEMFREYNQSHLPVREQTKVVGHAVRAMYLFTAMADVAHETGDASLREACERLWRNLTTRQMYLTGGIGQTSVIEGFTHDYDLPNDSAYAETCAAIGLVFWAHRMTLLTGESRYVDVLERALHNAVISGMSQDGRRFFYSNPLESTGDVERQDWFEVACCPPNLARLLTSLGQYVYAVADGEIVVNLYVSGTVTTDLPSGSVSIRQHGDEPWSGDVAIDVEPDSLCRFTLSLRIPEWAGGAALELNGEPIAAEPDDKGYVRIDRGWNPGDRLRLSLAMPVRRRYAHPRVRDDAGRVALERGPLVYCFEQVDNVEPLHALALPRTATVSVNGGTTSPFVHLHARGSRAVDEGWQDHLYRDDPPNAAVTELGAVPFFAWNNRGTGPMQVWIREQEGGA